MFPLGQLSESRAVYRGPEISTWHCDKTKAFEILVNYSQTYFFVCRSHCSVQNFSNFCCFWDIENCISAWPSIGDNFWPAVTFFFLLFEHWKYQIRWVQGLNFQIHALVYIQQIGLGFTKFYNKVSTILSCEQLPGDFWDIFFVLYIIYL